MKDENTLYVEYDYAGASSGLRPVSLRYPNGRLLHDDELYDYDGVSQLVGLERGQLSAGRDAVTTKTFGGDWGLDATGNWTAFRQDANGDGAWDLDQTRRHNKANEATSVSSWATPTHDRAGNMTSMPKPGNPADALTTTFDAWNRMVKVEEGEDTVAEYAYTGDNRRAVKKVYSGGVLSEARHFYYTDQWQAIEERTALGDTIATDPDTQYVWGTRYVDHLILRDRHATTSGAVTERLYALRDANWNVTALVDILGTPLERFTYTAYGTVEVRPPLFQPTGAPSVYAWPYTYTTRRLDEETGLMYYRNRMYHAELGRFVGRDPVGYVIGNSNLHAYVAGRVTTSLDPFGLQENPNAQPPVVRLPPPSISSRDDLERALEILYNDESLGTKDGPCQVIPFNQFIEYLRQKGLTRGQEDVLAFGCVGIACLVGDNMESPKRPGDRPRLPEESASLNPTHPKTYCYTGKDAEKMASNRNCPRGYESFVFAKQGRWKNGQPPATLPDGRLADNMSMVGNTKPNDFNYVSLIGGYYVSANSAAGGPNAVVTICSEPRNVASGFPATMWCSQCICVE